MSTHRRGGALVAGSSLEISKDRPVKVLVFDRTRSLGHDVRQALSSYEHPVEVTDCGDSDLLARQLTNEHFDVLVAGPGLDYRAGFERLRIIREEIPAMAVLIATTETDVDVRQVVRAGALDLLMLPLATNALEEALVRAIRITAKVMPTSSTSTALEPVSTRRPPTRVITIASASGGCGKTFLATNLAWFLTTHGKRKVCIIDLDPFGEVSTSLRLRPRYTITDLIHHTNGTEETARDLSEQFPQFCEVDQSGIHVLSSPRDPTESSTIHPSEVGQLIDAARRHFDHVIIDTPPALADSVVTAYNRSDELLVMATLDVPSIRNMQVFLGTIDRLGVSADGIRLILNKAEPGASVELQQILKLFPQGFDATLPYAREVQKALNAGRPVLDTNPHAEITRQFGLSMSRLLAEDERAAFLDHHNAHRPSRFRRWFSNDKDGAA